MRMGKVKKYFQLEQKMKYLGYIKYNVVKPFVVEVYSDHKSFYPKAVIITRIVAKCMHSILYLNIGWSRAKEKTNYRDASGNK